MRALSRHAPANGKGVVSGLRAGEDGRPRQGNQNMGTHADRWIAAGRSPLAAARDAAEHGWCATPAVRPAAGGSPGMRSAPPHGQEMSDPGGTVQAVDVAECYVWSRSWHGL